jgi:lipoprotein signal peptidase
MMVLLAGSLLVVLIDHAFKFLVLHRLGTESISLGPIGSVRSVQTQIWIARAPCGPKLAKLWVLWICAALALTLVTTLVPASGWFCALLLGGSLSHAVESSLRGSICDYICLRFWPAFNFADLAITAGALGMAATLVKVVANAVA